MAPASFSAWSHTMRDSIELRGLGTTLPASTLTDDQVHVLQTIAVTFASVSVASSIVTFYWFSRMRRSFRHDLVMALIQSDMFKALWFLIFPAVVFTQGPVKSDSSFCQANGFFLSLGIEASDFAVLMIALHSALYIFNANRKSAAGQGGLYPYRYFALAVWIVCPFLLAGLGFVNSAFISQTTYCYLPVRPFWYRIALSWIPRYVIFLTIISIYSAIYLYVRFKFRDFGNTTAYAPDSLETVKNATPKPRKRHSLPPTPTLARHGLLPGSRQSSMAGPDLRKFSDSTLNSYRWQPRNSVAGLPAGTAAMERRGSLVPESPLYEHDDPFLANYYTANEQIPILDVTSGHPAESTIGVASSAPSTPARSTMNMMGFLRKQPQHPESTAYPSTATSDLELVDSRGRNLAASEMMQTRQRIARQLRHLFIYPVVYMAMWLLPFVSHCLQYDDRYVTNPPYVLVAISTMILCSQCTVDCIIFSVREKPWQHIPGTKGGFWESFRFWQRSRHASFSQPQRGPGRSRVEMVLEARHAYKRREAEMAARQRDVNIVTGPASPSVERSWWDEAGGGFDGTMSTVVEEDSTPTGLGELPSTEGASQASSSTAIAGQTGWRKSSIPWFSDRPIDDER